MRALSGYELLQRGYELRHAAETSRQLPITQQAIVDIQRLLLQWLSRKLLSHGLARDPLMDISFIECDDVDYGNRLKMGIRATMLEDCY